MKPVSALDKALTAALRSHLDAMQGAEHMAAHVRALSYRMPLIVRIGNRGWQYSISGCFGAVR
ncbi:hypothetical protein M3I54_22615 [Paraburkholderia sp. CNPSo 3274]|uniref:hypothetical protein n=1 Tax=Paraburkholderia sp. CNPSo 3274 TaxID=2940932 RepID=UPI0020B87901|nr:hypothetical protein [Paraburkholderia sp. CNPSo 3274]MCP3709740.1 hypothetical protein [Paraburkholderia sp. CNPSo 3274]